MKAAPTAAARRIVMAGQRRWTMSTIATTANGHDTHVTQVRWVESGRCRRLRQDADADQRDDQEHGRPVRRDDPGGVRQRPARAARRCRRASPRTTRRSSCAAPRWGRSHHGGWVSAIACSAPSRWPHDGGRGSSRPDRRWTTGSTTMPCHAAPGPATARWNHIGVSPTRVADGRRPPRRSLGPHHPAENEGDGDDEVGAVGQGQPAESPGDESGDQLGPSADDRSSARRTRRTTA